VPRLGGICEARAEGAGCRAGAQDDRDHERHTAGEHSMTSHLLNHGSRERECRLGIKVLLWMLA
jgi:hypothetical protein